jgi:hypothetical protein
MTITIKPKNYNVLLAVIAALLGVIVLVLIINTTKYNRTLDNEQAIVAGTTQTAPDYALLTTDSEIASYEKYKKEILSSSYQLQLFPDFIRVMDGVREVGRLQYNTSLGRMITRDNW